MYPLRYIKCVNIQNKAEMEMTIMGSIKVNRIMLLLGVIVAGLTIMVLVFRGSALAQSNISSVTTNQVLFNQAQGLIDKVSAAIPAEQSLGRDTSQLQAALADLEQIVNGTTTKGEQTIEGNGTRKSPIITDYSERADPRNPERALSLSYSQLKQIFDNFKAAYPSDFASTTTSAGLPATGASSPTSTVTTTTPTVTATTTTTGTVSLPSTGTVNSSGNQAQALISRAQLAINSGNTRGLDTSLLQAALVDLQEIVNNTNDKGSDVIEGNGTRKSPIIIDYSEKAYRRDPQRALQLSYEQLKQILDNFVAANP
jgi:hypothetical protein